MARKVSRFLLFLPLSLIFAALIWTIFVDGKFYYCSDKIPLLDFLPPFVHSGMYGATGDYWIASPGIVWMIWFLLIGVAVATSYFLAKNYKH